MKRKCSIIITGFLLWLIHGSDIYAQSHLNSAVFTSYSTQNELKLVSETTGIGDNYVGYAYVELGSTPFADKKSNWAYTQMFWEQKFWESPIYIHTEFRTILAGDSYDSSIYLGAAYTFGYDAGFLAIEPLYKYNRLEGHGAQLSVVGGWEWKHISLAHFTDIYRTSRMDKAFATYNECRLFYKMTPRLQIGTVGIMAYSCQKHFDALSVSIALKVNL
jgi:hypothetical protein